MDRRPWTGRALRQWQRWLTAQSRPDSLYVVEHGAFQTRITRMPRPHDKDAGLRARALVPDLSGDAAGLIEGASGSSPYLMSLTAHESVWLAQALTRSPELVLQEALAATADAAPDQLSAALRQAKRRVALITALADLGGVWDLKAVTGAMTSLADAALQATLQSLVADEIRRGKLPGATPDDSLDAAGMIAIAMGKMGAHELNYSSDIDLICLFDDARYAGTEAEARQAFIRVTRRMTAMLSDITGDGYVFRTDLRLRPDAAVTPVCLSMSAAESYYEAEGRTWERAAYIKARPAAGDLTAGARFLQQLTPFVWRKHLDFAAIQDAHDMRLRIRDHRRLHGKLRIEGHDLKLGQGGIREIEFFTQTRQLIAGGRDPSLRDPTTIGGLQALAAAGWVPQDVAAELSDHYRAHREVEHRLQMVGDAQTHSLPVTEDGIARIAALCDLDLAAFRAGLMVRLERVAALTDSFFAPSAPTLSSPSLSDDAARIVEGWQRYPALRSERARAVFQRLRPGLLARLDQAADKTEALMAFDGFLSGLPAGVQIFSLFEANLQLVDLIIDIVATSPALAKYLARNAGVLDAVIGGSFFAPWPGQVALETALSGQLMLAPDYEARLDSARRWLKEWHFRIGVHHLRGLIDAGEAGQQYADLAGAVLAALWPVVGQEFARKHGGAPGLGAVVLGMGSLGAGRLNAGSDLDLIVIYDAQGQEASDGPRPLATRAYFAKLTQALVTALTAPMAEGRLYEVDMRLRPSGRQGPVATSLQSFCDYQDNDAWTWEHLALTRARAMAGDATLATRIEAFRQGLIARKGKGPDVARDVAEMRARLQREKPAAGGWDARNGPGRLMDIELFAQTVALWAASPAQDLPGQIAAGKGSVLSQNAAQCLLDSYSLLWRIHAGARLLTDEALDLARLGGSGRAFLMRDDPVATAEALAAAMDAASSRAAAVIDKALDRAGGTERAVRDGHDPDRG